MKIKQKEAPFNPITITLETQQEAEKFISIIDKIDWYRNNANPPPDVTEEEYKLVVQISNSFGHLGFLEGRSPRF